MTCGVCPKNGVLCETVPSGLQQPQALPQALPLQVIVDCGHGFATACGAVAPALPQNNVAHSSRNAQLQAELQNMCKYVEQHPGGDADTREQEAAAVARLWLAVDPHRRPLHRHSAP